MKVLIILCPVFLLFLQCCSKDFSPTYTDGEGNVYLETDKEIYTSNETIKFYMVNNTNRSVYSHPPGDWALSKKIDENWYVVYPQNIIMVVLPPKEWKAGRKLIATYTIQDTGLYKIQMFLSWDKEAKYKEDLGIVFSNNFQIKSDT